MRSYLATVSTESQTPATQPDIAAQETLTAENVEDIDLDDNWVDCVPELENPGAGATSGFFDFNNNRTKDFDIYGVLIENKTTAWSYNPTKTFGLDVQRAFTIVIENAEMTERTFRLEIANQPLDPTGDATKVRASWEQLPKRVLCWGPSMEVPSSSCWAGAGSSGQISRWSHCFSRC